jgi:hypothetical protein
MSYSKTVMDAIDRFQDDMQFLGYQNPVEIALTPADYARFLSIPDIGGFIFDGRVTKTTFQGTVISPKEPPR